MDQFVKKWSKHESEHDQIVTCQIRYINPEFAESSSAENLVGITKIVSNVEEIDEIKKIEPKKLVDISLFDLGYNYDYILDWHMIKQPEKDDLYYLLRFMFERHLKTTIQISIGDMHFNCHLAVLQVYSKFFMEMEPALIVTLPAEKVSQKAFMIIYKWMLSDEPMIDRKNSVELFLAATYLRIESLMEQCWFYFDNECMEDDLAAVLYVETRRIPALNVIRNLMLTRIGKFFLTFVASRDFLDLPKKHVAYLLSTSKICVNTEIEIFFTAVRWMSHDWERRRQSLKALMECVRFHLMPIWYLVHLTRNRENEIIEYIVTAPEIEENINEAISTVTSSMYNDICEMESNNPENDATSVISTTLYRQRHWIEDKACQYHHLLGCPNMRELKYSDFEAYLKSLQLQPTNHWKTCEEIDVKKQSIRPCPCCGMHRTLLPTQLPVKFVKTKV